MILETDPIIVEKLSSEREEENWNFRTFLKGFDLDIKDLDAMVHQHYEAIAIQIDCSSCSNCCRGVSPVLDSSDVARISTGLEISSKAFIERYLTTDEDGDLIFQEMPCPLLNDNLCRAYKHRPKVCRSYPHLQKDEFVFRLVQAVQNCSVCPIVYNVYERLKGDLWSEFSDWLEDEEGFE